MKHGNLIALVGHGKSGDLARLVAALWRSVGMRAIAMHPDDYYHGDAAMEPDQYIFLSESGKSMWDIVNKEVNRTSCSVMTYVTNGFVEHSSCRIVNLRTWGSGDGIEGWPEIPIQWSINVIRWAAREIDAHLDETGFTKEQYRLGHPAQTR